VDNSENFIRFFQFERIVNMLEQFQLKVVYKGVNNKILELSEIVSSFDKYGKESKYKKGSRGDSGFRNH